MRIQRSMKTFTWQCTPMLLRPCDRGISALVKNTSSSTEKQKAAIISQFELQPKVAGDVDDRVTALRQVGTDPAIAGGNDCHVRSNGLIPSVQISHQRLSLAWGQR